MCRRSLAIFSLNFFRQKSALVSGIVVALQPCRCQKQPWTNKTALKRGKTISGEPGSFLSWRRYLKPSWCNDFRSFISGQVFFCPTLDMIFERVALSTVSTILPTLAVAHILSTIDSSLSSCLLFFKNSE
jgi:hypothetical protein